MTRDGGQTWSNVTPADMPDLGRVSVIDASSFDAGSAYAAVKRPLLDDSAPYIFRTHDFGRTWTKIVTGIAPTHYVHAVREDPSRRGLLYAGTQHGVAMSFDDGDHWKSLSLNLPDTPVADVVVESNDLVIATHGRGFYILDNLGPLRQTGAPGSVGDAYLFRPNDAIRSMGGARVQYVLRRPAQALTIDVVDAQGVVIRSFVGDASRGGAAGGISTGAPAGSVSGSAGRAGVAAPVLLSPGLNSVTWDLRYPGATSFPGIVLWGGNVAGPMAPPGTYQVRMTVDGQVQTQSLVVRRHPLFAATDADLRQQFDLAIQIRDKTSEANNTVIRIRAIKTQVDDRVSKSSDARLKAAGQTLSANLSVVEAAVYQVRNQSGQDPLNFPIKINNRLASLLTVVNRGDGKPVGNVIPIFNDLVRELKVQTDRFAAVLARDLAAFNVEVRRIGLDAVQ